MATHTKGLKKRDTASQTAATAERASHGVVSVGGRVRRPGRCCPGQRVCAYASTADSTGDLQNTGAATVGKRRPAGLLLDLEEGRRGSGKCEAQREENAEALFGGLSCHRQLRRAVLDRRRAALVLCAQLRLFRCLRAADRWDRAAQRAEPRVARILFSWSGKVQK